MKIFTIVGARPNFIKVAPLHRELAKQADITSKIVHTGQHFDYLMSGIFFEQLGLPKPDYFLGVSEGSPTEQTAEIMLAFEKVVKTDRPDLVIVVGDVTSTLACALVCAKERIKVAHIEAGLRSGDRSMPEEINRILTDAIADEFFVTEKSAVENLLRENVPASRIHFVGNLMIDSLVQCSAKIDQVGNIEKLGLLPQSYILMTMHRPANVDQVDGLFKIVSIIRDLSKLKQVVFPMHPRTRKKIAAFDLEKDFKTVKNLKVLDPQGYLEFIGLLKNASMVITDSGGIQEEATYLGIPCITLRENTERPVTVEVGTNYLMPDFNIDSVKNLAVNILSGTFKKGAIPEFWDGKAAERIVAVLREKYINSYVCAK
ncbi:non-hydrolyzing UDP-N-acetylglucosamine 2-epimerase [Dyadobacter luticola]|uniref:UDP-N-acetylglucosamine 2-epimerase (Non-hydrolyzing) n=1 Tax=Dyadobacter luticola TaxID=1979387 RepID=A0A5R9KXE3_9BACT|nr:UDP-N-acetylglucosamine 2-epimerase (non-hydrolyzing) [Dyadobacter luticola]TLV00956.1 UDP-N-acetylglucosamine 2-epimerase (non-hydrolyzing) [Dyadobacter luticola]